MHPQGFVFVIFTFLILRQSHLQITACPLHSLTVSKLLISFSFATIRQLSTCVVSVDRPPLYYSIKLSYSTMIPVFGKWFDLKLA